MIFRISQDSPVYGRLSMVPVVASFCFLLHYFTLLAIPLWSLWTGTKIES